MASQEVEALLALREKHSQALSHLRREDPEFKLHADRLVDEIRRISRQLAHLSVQEPTPSLSSFSSTDSMYGGLKRPYSSTQDALDLPIKRVSTSPSGASETQDEITPTHQQAAVITDSDDDLEIAEVRTVPQHKHLNDPPVLLKNETPEDFVIAREVKHEPRSMPIINTSELHKLFAKYASPATTSYYATEFVKLFSNERHQHDLFTFLNQVLPQWSDDNRNYGVMSIVRIERQRLELKLDLRELNAQIDRKNQHYKQLRLQPDIRNPSSVTALQASQLLRAMALGAGQKGTVQRNMQQLIICQKNITKGLVPNCKEFFARLIKATMGPSTNDYDLVGFLSNSQKEQLDEEQSLILRQAQRLVENSMHLTQMSQPVRSLPTGVATLSEPHVADQNYRPPNLLRNNRPSSLFGNNTLNHTPLTSAELRNRYIHADYRIRGERDSDSEDDDYPHRLGGSHTDFDRQKLEELIENINLDQEIPPEQRQGTPPELNVNLYEHQKLGLTWLQNTEEKAKGGLLADDMGLGKTLQMIALMVSRASDTELKTNLIIAPVALIHQWAREIKRFVKPSHELKVLVYHFGSNPSLKRDRDSLDLSQFDCVITTYQTVLQDHGKAVDPDQQAPLFKTSWYRIILDEAHFIKNRFAKTSIACAKLTSRYRWCLSGTPMQNKVEELYPVIRFLRLEPYDDWPKFQRDFVRGIEKFRSSGAVKKFNVLLQAIALRRTKNSKVDGKPLLQLPPKTVDMVSRTFDKDETDYYTALESKTQGNMNKYIRENSFSRNIQNILVLLLRLRQACCHPKLLERSEMLKNDKAHRGRLTEETINLARDYTESIVNRVTTESQNEGVFTCPICQEPCPASYTLMFYPCGHPICKDCVYTHFYETEQSAEDEVEEPGALQIAKSRGPKSTCCACRQEVYLKEMVDFNTFELVHIDNLSNGQILQKWKLDRAEQIAARKKKKALLHTRKQELQNERLINEDMDMFENDISNNKVSWRQLRQRSALIDDDDDSIISFSDESESEVKVNFNWDSDDDETQDQDTSPEAQIKAEEDKSVKEPTNAEKVVKEEKDNFNDNPIRADQDTMNSIVDGLGLSRLFQDGWVSSTKVDECVRKIHNIYKEFPGEKILIFSQFTSMLDLLEVPLISEGIDYLRYDGQMTAGDRNQSVTDFFDKPEIKTMLISLRAGNVGLTLTCASHVIILDPFWNPFVEDQAMDRSHRIGQQRPVHVHRLVVAGTVEDRILSLQEKKREVIESAWGEGGRSELSRLTKDDILYLFGMRQRPETSQQTRVPGTFPERQ